MEYPNKYKEQITLHTKCLKILEGIEEFLRRLNRAEDNLDKWDRRIGNIHLIYYRKYIVHDVELYRHTVKRMEEYYEGYSRKVCTLLNLYQGKGLLDCILSGTGNVFEFNPQNAMPTLQSLCDTAAPKVFGYIDHIYQDYGTEELNAMT